MSKRDGSVCVQMWNEKRCTCRTICGDLHGARDNIYVCPLPTIVSPLPARWQSEFLYFLFLLISIGASERVSEGVENFFFCIKCLLPPYENVE